MPYHFSMSQSFTIKLEDKEKERLSRLALRYGLSLAEFARKVLVELEEGFPHESFEEYENPEELKASFNRALRDWQGGRVQTKL